MRSVILLIILCGYCSAIAWSQTQTPAVESTLEILSIDTGKRKTVYQVNNHFEAPNWSPDGKYLLYNSRGKIYKLPVAGGEPVQLNFAFADRCNNDHGLSPDGKQIVISHNQPPAGKSLIYIAPAEGGTPRQITPQGPSYWHGWSPDGQMLAYCAERDGEYDVYTIPVGGGEEKRLTTAKGLDDGPDYTADGKYIYFNSNRTSLMQIWRMKPDGSGQEQVTDDEYNNWFPHPSPDGKWLIFLSYDKSVDSGAHPPNKQVQLRLMPLKGGKPRTVAKLFGGQGTINVPSWSPDSKQVAFVSYRVLNE
jgi:Tol biopolymer transport system component